MTFALFAPKMKEAPLLPSVRVLVKWEGGTQSLGEKVCLHCTEVCLYKIIHMFFAIKYASRFRCCLWLTASPETADCRRKFFLLSPKRRGTVMQSRSMKCYQCHKSPNGVCMCALQWSQSTCSARGISEITRCNWCLYKTGSICFFLLVVNVQCDNVNEPSVALLTLSCHCYFLSFPLSCGY